MEKIVVFDLDDTLYLERDYVFSGYQAVDRYLLENYHIADFYHRARDSFYTGDRSRVFDDVLAMLFADVNDRLIQELVHVYRNHLPDIRLPEESREVLSALVDRKVGLGLITDGYLAVQRNKIAALGLESWMSCIVCTDQWGKGYWKPSLRPFYYVMNYFSGRPEDCVYIGDNPAKDFYPARQLGWKTVRYCAKDGIHSGVNGEPGYEAHVEISHLSQLLGLIEEL